MNPNVPPADAVLEPELRELVFDLDAAQRAKTAEKFMRWADQLTQSVIVTNPDLIVLAPPPKVPRGFVLVNLAQWQQDEFRQLARECGVNLRDVLRWAIIHTRCKLKERIKLAETLGVHPRECWQFRMDEPNN